MIWRLLIALLLLPTSAWAATTVDHVTSVTHIAGKIQQQGPWEINVKHITSMTHISGAVMIRDQAGNLVTVTGGELNVNCTGCAAASVVNVAHISSVVHVVGTLTVSGGNIGVDQSGAWTVQATHQAGNWNISHVTSITHVAGAVAIRDAETNRTAHVNSNGELEVSCSGCGVATSVAVTHISSALHLAGNVNDNANDALRVTVVTHTTVGGTISHISSVTHVTTNSTAPVHVVASTGSANMVCHSVTAIHQVATSGFIAHGAAGSRIFICGVLLVSEGESNVSIVEGTGAGCGTGTQGLIGGTAASVPISENGGFSAVAPFPWISTRVAGNYLCLLKSHASATVSGTITYRGSP